MSISINLYRVSPAENIAELKDLGQELANAAATKLALEKMTEDLATIFLNNVDPFNDAETIPYKMLFGDGGFEMFDYPEIGGFIPSADISTIVEWIFQNNITSPEGFADMYDNLSADVQNQLNDIGAPGKEILYSDFVKPLTDFYTAALAHKNAVLVCGE